MVTHRMVIIEFSVYDKLEKIRFFEETFLLADISIEVVLGRLIFILSNANIRFIKKEFE